MDPVEKIFAEQVLLDQLFQVLVGGRDKPDIPPTGASAHRIKLTLLEHPEEFRLGCERHVTDFVEKDGPSVASPNNPFENLVAPVKAPFSWPNSSLSKRVSGNAAQIYCHK